MGNQVRKPTEAELAILQILWNKKQAVTVRQVHEELRKDRNTGYTTTLKMMQIMHEKGMLSRKKDGRTHQYWPTINQEDAQQKMVSRMIDKLFGGSALKLVQQALGGATTSKEELDEIRAYLNQIENKDNK